MALDKSAVPELDFTVDSTIEQFSVSMEEFLKSMPKNDNYRVGFIASGVCVIDQNTPPRILLIQRAENDSMPSRWETPGGAVDDEDKTILYGVARELWEESGLIAESIGPQVGEGHIFLTRSQKIVCKYSFLAQVRDDGAGLTVKLDPEEHQAYVWATEIEVLSENVGDAKLVFTTKAQKRTVLDAFAAARMKS